MEELRKKYKRGEIDKKTYQEKLTELTIFNLKAINYKYVGKIADGTHGVVVEMKSPETVLNVAVKIVFDDFELEHGLMSWPKLIHENILPLITWRVIWQTNSKLFISLKHDKTLQNKISSFRGDFNGFEKAVNYTRDIANAINYVHHQGLCHLNLTPDRIFVDHSNKARLGGFAYLTSKDTKHVKFGTAAVFRPPEVYPGTNRKVEGQKFDIWSMGILAVETFTGEYLSKEMSKWQAQPVTWHMQLYGLLYEVLEKETFSELVKKHMPNWKADEEKLDQVLNFIKSCLIFNLEDRPSVDDLLKLKIFGGSVEKYCPKEPPDIWAEMVWSMDLVMKASEKRNINMSDSDFDIFDDENNYNEKPSDEGLEIMDATVKNYDEFCYNDGGVKEEKRKENDVDDVDDMNNSMNDRDVKEEKIKENDVDDMNNSMSDRDVKEEQINDIGNMNYSMNDRDVKEEKIKENDVDDINNSMSDGDVKEEQMKENDLGNMNYSVDDRGVKEEKIKEIDICDMNISMNDNVKEEIIKENDIGDMNNSMSDRDVKEEKIKENDIGHLNYSVDDIDVKEEKRKENDIGDINISMSDRDVKEGKIKDNDVRDMMKDNDIKNYETEFDKKDEELNMKDKKNDIPNSDITKTLPDSFETNRRKKRLKRRRKKVESEKIIDSSNTDTDAKPERINLERRKTRKKRSNKNLVKENETVNFSNENSIKHNLENLHQRPRLSLNKAQLDYKYLEMQEYQNSCKSFTQKQSVNMYFKMNQECSLNICEKRDDTTLKQRLPRTTYTSKSMIEMAEKSPATSSSTDHKSVRKTYSPEIVKQKIIKSPATSSSENRRSIRNTYSLKNVRTIQDDGSEDLEPGEVPVFKKDYDIILDKQRPHYSVASLSGMFNNNDEDDLEEGEIDPHNPVPIITDSSDGIVSNHNTAPNAVAISEWKLFLLDIQQLHRMKVLTTIQSLAEFVDVSNIFDPGGNDRRKI